MKCSAAECPPDGAVARHGSLHLYWPTTGNSGSAAARQNIFIIYWMIISFPVNSSDTCKLFGPVITHSESKQKKTPNCFNKVRPGSSRLFYITKLISLLNSCHMTELQFLRRFSLTWFKSSSWGPDTWKHFRLGGNQDRREEGYRCLYDPDSEAPQSEGIPQNTETRLQTLTSAETQTEDVKAQSYI